MNGSDDILLEIPNRRKDCYGWVVCSTCKRPVPPLQVARTGRGRGTRYRCRKCARERAFWRRNKLGAEGKA